MTSNSDNEFLTIVVAGMRFEVWENIQMTLGLETFPRTFSITYYEPTEDLGMNGFRHLRYFTPGEVIQVYIGDEIMIYGYIDATTPGFDGSNVSYKITGRNATCDLVDPSAELITPSGFFNASIASGSCEELITNLIKPFDLDVVFKSESLANVTVPTFQVNLGEKAFNIIERIGRFVGFIVYDNGFGQLVIADPGTEPLGQKPLIDITHHEIISASADFNISQRFSEYHYFVNSTIMYGDNRAGAGIAMNDPKIHGIAKDPLFKTLKTIKGNPRNRKHIALTDAFQIVNPRSNTNAPLTQLSAVWHMNRAMGRSQVFQTTLGGWRDQYEQLWRPNTKVTFNLPGLYFGTETMQQEPDMLIADVEFVKDNDGTSTRIRLMPPQAFAVEPFNITPLLQDRKEAIQPTPNKQSTPLVPTINT